MKTKLFANEIIGVVMNYFQTKEWLEENFNEGSPLSTDSISRLIADVDELTTIDNEPYRWCLRYLRYMEADRYLDEEGKALSIFNIYTAIMHKDEESLRPMLDVLRGSNDAAGSRLLIALNGFLEEKEVER